MSLAEAHSIADPVVKAIVRLEFEDGLRTGVFPGALAATVSLGSISNPLGLGLVMGAF